MRSKTSDYPTILVVDDNPDNLSYLQRLLARHHYCVLTAINGDLALQTLQQVLPDLVLLDIIMPGLNGYEVCRRIKAEERTRAIPIIFLSALHAVEEKIAAFEAGGVDYITKPFQKEEVLMRIRTHVALYALQDQLREENLRFRILEDAALGGLMIHDEQRILEANQRCAAIFGCSHAELLDKPFLDRIAPAYRATLIEHLQTPDRPPHTLTGLRPDGSVIPLEVQHRTMLYQGRSVWVMAMRDLSQQRLLEQENLVLRQTLLASMRFGDLVGKSPAMQKVYALIVKAAATEYNVLITGESGTGKELVARTIHALSRRQHRTFRPVNCSAVTETLFEREFFGHRKGAFTGADRDQPGFLSAAEGGTLFLDEVTELAPNMQTKLLRALDNKEYTPVGDTAVKRTDIRIIAATNRDPNRLLREGLLREDFFYRIDVISIHLPALRERCEDIPLLLDHFLSLESPNAPVHLPLNMLDAFQCAEWPGNVRQLHNAVQRYLTTQEFAGGGVSETPDIPLASGLSEAVARFEHQVLRQALERTQGNKTAAADLLKISRRALYKKLAKYGMA